MDLPSRVLGDHGVENVDIPAARFIMIASSWKECSQPAYSAIMADVNRVLSAHYKDVFKFLQESMLLDSQNEVHLFALHFVYLPHINASLQEFKCQWNHHCLRTADH